jgi:hypothetical protein
VAPRPEILRLPGTTDDHPVGMWVLAPQLWEDLLVQHGLTMQAVTAIDSPKPDNHVSCRLCAARRSQRVPSPAYGGHAVPVLRNDDRNPTTVRREAKPWTR